MKRPVDGREALIAEALGDFVKVLDRIEALMPRLDEARDQLETTASALLRNVEPFKRGIAAAALETQNKTIANIRENVRPVVRRVVEEETEAMREAGRALFNAEVIPPLRQLTTRLHHAIEAAHHPWERWLVHAGTVFATAVAMTLLLSTQRPARVTVPEPTVITDAPAPAPPASHSGRARAPK
jgi:hypothetical protein